MAIEVGEAIGAATWSSYLVNGDDSGLDAREKALADAWAARLAPARVVDVERDESGQPFDPSFTWSYGFHTGDDCDGGEVLTYVTHAPAPKSREACSHELRAAGYNHTDSNRYARVTGKGMAWAFVVPDGDGFKINWPESGK